MGGDVEIYKIMEIIDEITDECEKKYGVKIKGVNNIFGGGDDGRIYIDFLADNGKIYCWRVQC